MNRFNTGNPINSLDERDFYDNCLSLDQAMNSTEPTWRDRFNVEKPTIDAALKSAGFMPAGFDFVTGGTLQPGDRNKAVYNPAPNGDNNWYRWNGVFPKEIDANSQPNPKNENNWVPVVIKTGVVEREALRRTYQEAGLNLVEGSFEQGGVLNNQNDVLLQERTGKAFSGPAGTVAAGTNPASGGFVDKSRQYVQNGDTVPVGTTHLVVLINGKPEDLIAWGTLTLPATINDVVPTTLNEFLECEISTDQGNFTFVSTETYNQRMNFEAKGWGAVGQLNDQPNIEKALAYAAGKSAIILEPNITYTFPNTLSISGNTYGGSGLKCLNGVAILKFNHNEVGLDIVGARQSGKNNWMFDYENLRITGTSRTLVRIGGGDTWHSRFNFCWIQGGDSTEDVVALTNTDKNDYRDYFATFNRCVFRNGNVLLNIGGRFVNGTLNKCLRAVNRVKLTDCDFYGHRVYGIYIGESQALDACNGHTFKGLHFDSANGAIADIRYKGPFTHIEAVHESGANFWYDFSGVGDGGFIVCDGIGVGGHISNFAINGSSIKSDHVEINSILQDLTIISYTSLGPTIHTRRIEANDIVGRPTKNIRLAGQDGYPAYLSRYNKASNTFTDFLGVDNAGIVTLSKGLQATDGSFNITRDTTTNLNTVNQVEVYEAIVTTTSSPSNIAVSKRLLVLSGSSGISDTEILTNLFGGATYTVSITRPSADIIRVSWTGFRNTYIRLVRVA